LRLFTWRASFCFTLWGVLERRFAATCFLVAEILLATLMVCQCVAAETSASPTQPVQTVTTNVAENALHWYGRPEWWQVLVAALGIGVISWQALEMRWATGEMRESTRAVKGQALIMEKQTKATEDLVSLQRVAMQQWVHADKWEADWRFSEKAEVIATISFEIINPTSFPLIVSNVYMTAGQALSDHTDIFLVPKEGHRFNYSINVFEPEPKYGETELRFDLAVFVYYQDAFKEAQLQVFGKTFIFDRSDMTARFEPYRGILPRLLERDDDDGGA
jgi:hypothetical protein